MDHQKAALATLESRYNIPPPLKGETTVEKNHVIKSEPVGGPPPPSNQPFLVGTYTVIGRVSTIRTHSNQLPCCVFLAVILLIASFICTSPLSLICTVPFLINISKVR